MSKTPFPLTLGEIAGRRPMLADYLTSVDPDGIEPSLTLDAWIAGLSAARLADIGMDRDQLLEQVAVLTAASQTGTGQIGSIRSLRVLGGRNKTGAQEKLDLTLVPGDVICIVGPTGSGKSRLLADIECLAQGDTPSGRKVLVDGVPPDPARRWASSGKLVAQLSQNMNFVVDLSVGEFIGMHADCRDIASRDDMVRDVIACANDLAGERFSAEVSLTQLSGGQTRALMIADVALLSASPVVLIDEIENAGIDRKRALELLIASDKIVLISTHDPILALLGQRRIVITNGSVTDVIETADEERANLAALERYDAIMADIREQLRHGARIDNLPEIFDAFSARPDGAQKKDYAWTR